MMYVVVETTIRGVEGHTLQHYNHKNDTFVPWMSEDAAFFPDCSANIPSLHRVLDIHSGFGVAQIVICVIIARYVLLCARFDGWRETGFHGGYRHGELSS